MVMVRLELVVIKLIVRVGIIITRIQLMEY